MAENADKNTNILGDEMFGGISPRILVMGTEHNGTIFRHSHRFYELVFIESGFTLHSCRGFTTVLTAGDMFVIKPYDAHSYISAYRTNLYNCLFYPDDFGMLRDEIMSLTGLNDTRDEQPTTILHVDMPERRELSLIFERIIWERQNKAEGWQLSVMSQFITFLVRYARIAKTQADRESSKEAVSIYTGYICKILRFIEENYAADISQSELSEAAGLSPDYMARTFKAAMSMTPTEYLRKFRVAKAMELLTTTEMSVGETAAAVGIPEISQFSRTFKQTAGISPTEYKRPSGV